MSEAHAALRQRIRVLRRGVVPPLVDGDYVTGALYRGAGPSGKRSLIYSREGKPRGMISVPIYDHSHHLASYALTGELLGKAGNNVKLALEDGSLLEFSRVSPNSLHCYDTWCRVFGYKCRYALSDEEVCRYCLIEEARQEYKYPDKRDIEETAQEIIDEATEHKPRSITITSASFDQPDEVAKRYLKLLEIVRRELALSIHIQIEPVEDLGLLREISELAESIGIFLEIHQEDIRKRICPGKAKLYPRERYEKNWDTAVEHFGWGNVMTTCLLGFGEDLEVVLASLADAASRGVCPLILLCRFHSEHMKDMIPSYLESSEDELFDFHVNAARALRKHGIDLRVGRGAGCIGCMACTATMEAFKVIENED
ncbi:hypothetical protein ACFL59_10425 [Planctomycetota bacterium]